MIPPEISFAINGAIGAILSVLIWSKSWSDVRSFDSVRHIIVGALSGYVYSLLHTQHNFPDGLMAVVVGYFGSDLIEAIFSRLKERILGE